MLYKDVLMQDIDVAQWRNAQTLLLDSAKERPRIVVIHDHGTVRKVAHSAGLPVAGAPERVSDEHATAKALYEANRDVVDFVAVFEREAFDAYFGAVQDSWNPDEELDEFVQRTYALLDDFPDGMVTHPQSARTTLGLQWRLGASRDQVVRAVHSFIDPGTTVVLGAFDGGALWASLVLGIDDQGSVASITTADPSQVELTGPRDDVAASVVEWVRTTHGSCSLGLFMTRAGAESLLTATDKAAVLRQAAASGDLVLSPVSSRLAGMLT